MRLVDLSLTFRTHRHDNGSFRLANHIIMQDDAPLTVGNKTYNNYTHKFGGFTSLVSILCARRNVEEACP